MSRLAHFTNDCLKDGQTRLIFIAAEMSKRFVKRTGDPKSLFAALDPLLRRFTEYQAIFVSDRQTMTNGAAL
ncbi:hypothetical protein [Bradyrhizobium yuanmingense]|uniref:hypothetical protein n=1 Tax=Bradyrhizobium yuanmingense TaxID=108015 RepID=UPI0023B95EFD|nr:hypothetical protein [Bradyrhizobium yuanmingense]